MKRFSFILSLILLTVTGYAQNEGQEDYYQFYAEASGEASLLFRGQEAVKYPYAGGYNGTYFWSGPNFEEGELFYNGKLYKNLLLNVNAHTQTLLARQVDGVVAIALDSELVEWFTMSGHKFVNLQKAGYDVEHPFYEVLYDNKSTLYKAVWKVEDTRGVSTNKMSQLEGYNPKLTRAFVPYEEYYYLSGDIFRKLSSKSSITKLYPGFKKQIKRFVSSNNLFQEKNLGIYFSRIMNFIDTNNE